MEFAEHPQATNVKHATDLILPKVGCDSVQYTLKCWLDFGYPVESESTDSSEARVDAYFEPPITFRCIGNCPEID